jgi:Holliday junction resolvasome RuvABC ATP-dependent DNA helicase subunit
MAVLDITIIIIRRTYLARPVLDAYWTEVVSIIEGGLKPDPQRVSAFATHLAERLEQGGEDRLAQRIRRLTERASLPAGATYKAGSLFADVEAQLNLVEIREPTDLAPYPVLPDDTDTELHRFVELQRRVADLERRGILPPSTLLLHGAPGCGKTMAAEAVAYDLQLPLLTIRLEAVMASYLGSSAKNLRRLFDGAQTQPSVLFLDEFDAVGKMRDDPQEIGEIKRLVSSLLQNLDRTKGRLLVIAATNHAHLLDKALWRRFDVVLHFPMPNAQLAEIIISRNLPQSSVDAKTIKALGLLANGLSGAAISQAVARALQNSILLPETAFTLLLTKAIVRQRLGGEDRIPNEHDVKSLVTAIHKTVDGHLSMRQIAQLIGCSPQNVHRILSSIKEPSNADAR